jgi:hypothetical protein
MRAPLNPQLEIARKLRNIDIPPVIKYIIAKSLNLRRPLYIPSNKELAGAKNKTGNKNNICSYLFVRKCRPNRIMRIIMKSDKQNITKREFNNNLCNLEGSLSSYSAAYFEEATEIPKSLNITKSEITANKKLYSPKS